MIDSFENLQVNAYPDITALTFNAIHKNYLKVILFTVFIVFGGIYTAFSVAYYFDLLNELSSYIYLFYLAFTLILMLVVVFSYIGFKKKKYAVRARDISYQSGIFFKNLTTVPFNRVQHIEVDEGPVSRYFGLASLSVFTAGDSSDDLEIKGLLKKEALQIKEFITTTIDE